MNAITLHPTPCEHLWGVVSRHGVALDQALIDAGHGVRR